MATQGPNAPGLASNNDSFGIYYWDNLDIALQASDDSRATVLLMPYTASNYLVASNFGFNLPANATVYGIQVEIERRSSSATREVKDKRLRIVKNGAIGSSDRANVGESWPGVDAVAYYGSNQDLWGETWTANDINSSDFGVAFAAEAGSKSVYAEVDFLTVTVTYAGAGEALVFGAVASANAVAPDPDVSLGVSIASVAGSATASAYAPAVKTGSDPIIYAPYADASASNPSPAVKSEANMQVFPSPVIAAFATPSIVVAPGDEPRLCLPPVAGWLAWVWQAPAVAKSLAPTLAQAPETRHMA